MAFDRPCRGKPALEVAKQVLRAPEMENIELYSFRAAALRDRLYIRIDKVMLMHIPQTCLVDFHFTFPSSEQQQGMQMALVLHEGSNQLF